MSNVLEHLHALINEARAEFAKLLGHGDAEVAAVVKAGVEKIDEVKSAVEADVPVLEHEAAADAEHVVTDAETEGIKPAEVEAVADAAHLAGETVKDAESAPAAETESASDTPASA